MSSMFDFKTNKSFFIPLWLFCEQVFPSPVNPLLQVQR